MTEVEQAQIEFGAGRYDQAREILAGCVEHGDPVACNLYGVLWLDGLGGAKEPLEAAKWLRISAEKGHGGSACRLARLYLEGIGVPQNVAEAVRWYQRTVFSEEENHIVDGDSAYELALLYLVGHGVNIDPVMAVKLLRYAVGVGQVDAMYRLGRAFLCGEGCDPDPRKALHLCLTAAEQGSHIASEWLETEAAQWCEPLASEGDGEALFLLGKLHLQGLGVRQDENTAFGYFKRAAEAGCHRAQIMLGVMYTNGIGCNKSVKNAEYWFDHTVVHLSA